MKMLDKLGHRVQKQPGEIGVEIELEGMGLPRENFGAWRVEPDGSLRGGSVELVMKRPTNRNLLPQKLEQVKKVLDGVDLVDSGRAGIHVHLNIQQMEEVKFVNLVTLYLIYENTLVSWCGANRVGNLFCLRVDDASGGLDTLRECVSSGEWLHAGTDRVRYASMNIKAVPQYGSLEFRALRSPVEMEVIQTWVNLLLRLKDAAAKFRDPIAIIEDFSVHGPDVAFRNVFGKLSDELEYDHEDVMRGVRNAQLIAYARPDWEEQPGDIDMEPPIEVNQDPNNLDHRMRLAEQRGEVHFEIDGRHFYNVCRKVDDGGNVVAEGRWYRGDLLAGIMRAPDRRLTKAQLEAKMFAIRHFGNHVLHHANLEDEAPPVRRDRFDNGVAAILNNL